MNMKKHFVLFTALLLQVAIVSVFAQNKVQHEWSEKRLTWEDFKPAKTDSLGRTSYIDVGITQILVSDKNGDMRDTYTVDITDESWYDPDKVTEWDLRYNQILFDMAEVSIRKALDDHHNHRVGLYEIYRQYYRYYESGKDLFAMESNYGKDTTIIKVYEKHIGEELERTKSVDMYSEKIPFNSFHSFGNGDFFTVCIFLGYENSNIIGRYSDDFKTFHGFNFGFSVPVRSFKFEFTGSVLWSRLLSDDFYYDSLNDYYWKKDKVVAEGELQFGVGYTILSHEKIELTPFVGLSLFRMQQGTGDKKRENEIMSNTPLTPGYYFGLETDWYYNQRLFRDLTPCLRFKLFCCNRNYENIGSVWSVNLGLSFCLINDEFSFR